MSKRVVLDCQHRAIVSDLRWDRFIAGELMLETCPRCGKRAAITGDRIKGVLTMLKGLEDR